MRRTKRSAIGATMALVLALWASAAFADAIYNDLDLTIDATLEEARFDIDAPTPPKTVTLAIQVLTSPPSDHPNCDLTNTKYIQLAINNSSPSVASAAWASGSDGKFEDNCTGTESVVVTPLAVGTTDITFSVSSSTALGSVTNTAPASFKAVVIDCSDTANAGDPLCPEPDPVITYVCNGPAAPAVANEHIRLSHPTPKKVRNPVDYENLISQVAKGNTDGTQAANYSDRGWTNPSTAAFTSRCLQPNGGLPAGTTTVDDGNGNLTHYLPINPAFDAAVLAYFHSLPGNPG